MDRISFSATRFNPVNPVNPVLIQFDFIPPFAVFASFCKKFSHPVPDPRMTGEVRGSAVRPSQIGRNDSG